MTMNHYFKIQLKKIKNITARLRLSALSDEDTVCGILYARYRITAAYYPDTSLEYFCITHFLTSFSAVQSIMNIEECVMLWFISNKKKKIKRRRTLWVHPIVELREAKGIYNLLHQDP